MHDHNGAPLKVGDRVLIEAEITDAWPQANVCNVTVRLVHPRKADGLCDSFTGSADTMVKWAEPQPAAVEGSLSNEGLQEALDEAHEPKPKPVDFDLGEKLLD